MKKLLISILIVCGLLTTGLDMPQDKASDAYIRDRVVMLKGMNHQCSGVEVQGRSGKNYILTAAHCAALIERGAMEAINEAGETDSVYFVAIDPAHDLMLLTSFDDQSIPVAERVSKHEKVHSLTHGHGAPTYRTDGELLAEITATVVMFRIFTPEDLNECPETNYQHAEGNVFESYCVRTLTLMGTTALIVPGSSGGPILNAAGELVGIVSAGDGTFGYMVPLRAIRRFLRDK